MIDLKYSLVIEATEDPTFFGFYSPDLEGFTGIGHSIEDCAIKLSGAWRSILNCLRNSPFQFPRKTQILQSL